MVADEPFGLTFLDVLRATNVQVSYLKGLEGSHAESSLFVVVIILGIPWWGTIKGGVLYTRPRQYRLTTDL